LIRLILLILLPNHTISMRSMRSMRKRTRPQLLSKPIRYVNLKGISNIVQIGNPHHRWTDLYHLLLTLSWPQLIALLGLMYVALNALFAVMFLLGGDGIANAQPGSFGDAFFFSVQTMASIGYGAMYPKSFYANLIVTIESILGLFWLTMATGLMFARFSRPTARVIFSRVAVVSVRDGIPTLMFRAANQRSNQILEAQMRLSVIRNVVTTEGEFMRRFFDLKLERSQTSIFALTWTALHPIDTESPLYGMTPDDLAEIEAELLVTVTGIDDTFSQTIHARHSYIPTEIFWNMRLADVITRAEDGRRAVNYHKFHEVEPLNSSLP
jgi:inward rectifier potassium channel